MEIRSKIQSKMQSKIQKNRIILVAVLGCLFLFSALGILWQSESGTEKDYAGKTFSISADSGFYDQDLEIAVTVPKNACVVYTSDCEEPTLETGTVYDNPIVITAGEETEATVLRFRVFYEDGTSSEVETRTYLCGKNSKSRYDTLVLSIVGEPDGLFGYENGILVPGKAYDRFLEENPGAHPGGGGLTANYTLRGREYERAVWLEMFDAQGKGILAQNGGIRVAGELSRLNNHKSIRLYARKEYDEEKSQFKYDFFGDLYSAVDGSLGQKYKRLLLKNSGQDYGHGFVRNELIGRLAAQAGFPDTQHVTPVCVYLNGIYYGSYWLCSNFDDQYFENRYGDFDGSFQILGGGEREKTAADEEVQEKAAAEEYNTLYNRFAGMDLKDDENYEQLTQWMDVENYLQYFAIENYVGNDDWPDANVKSYCYLAGESGYGEGVFDGRYRMLLYDTDYGFGLLYYYDTIGCLVNEMTLEKILYEKAPLFAALMEREDCRAYFTSYTLDLMNGAMGAENVSEQVDILHDQHRQELSRTLEVPGLVGGLLLDESQLSMEVVEKNILQIKNFATVRPQYVLEDIEDKFGYGKQYTLHVICEDVLGGVQINSLLNEKEDYTGTYLKELPVTLTAKPGINEQFSCWLVDGVPYTEEVLVLQGDKVTGDSVEVRLVTVKSETPQLQIAAVSAKGHDDFIDICNLSDKAVSTKGYYLSDTEDLYKYRLPVLVVEPGETIRFVGKDNYSVESLGQFTVNFNLKEGEVLSLSYLDRTCDRVLIPDLSADGVYVRNFSEDRYVEQKQ